LASTRPREYWPVVKDILALQLINEGQVPKITVNAMLKASSNDQDIIDRCEISLDPEIQL
jgi:hypothetical protein